MSEPTRGEQEPARQFEDELEAFRRFLELLSSYQIIPKINEREALAFLVESFRQQYQEEWVQALDVFLGELDERFHEKGELGGVAKLSQELNDRYIKKLANDLLSESNPVRKNNLSVLKKQIEEDWDIRKEIIRENRLPPIGSVIGEHKPLWYPLTQK